MKKTALAVAAFFALQVGSSFAAPINDLSRGQTAAGFSTETVYLEHQVTNSFTLGYQNVDYAYGQDDLYGQFKLDNSLRGIVGSRDSGSGSSKLYLGLAAKGALSPDWQGHAAFVAGSEFKELQAGASYAIAKNVDLNLTYHSFMPDGGKTKSGADFGATFKF